MVREMRKRTNERFAVSEVFSQTFEIYRGSIVKLLGMALVVLLPVYIVDAALPGLFPLEILIGAFAYAWLGGAVIQLIQDQSVEKPKDRSVGQLLGSVWPRLWPLFLLNLMLSIAISIGFVVFIVPGVILGLMWFVAIPVFMIEKLGVFDSMLRSSDLTEGRRLRILPIAFVVFLIEAVPFGLGFMLPHLAAQAVGLITDAIALPFYAIVGTVLYLRLRGSSIQG